MAILRTQDGWPDVYCANAVTLPGAFESDELAKHQISSIGNITAMDEELGPGHVINDESVTSRGTIKFHLTSHVMPQTKFQLWR